MLSVVLIMILASPALIPLSSSRSLSETARAEANDPQPLRMPGIAGHGRHAGPARAASLTRAESQLGQTRRGVDSGYVGSDQLAWSGRDWRMPVWLWAGLATMFVSVLHIIIDFGVGLFGLHGR